MSGNPSVHDEKGFKAYLRQQQVDATLPRLSNSSEGNILFTSLLLGGALISDLQAVSAWSFVAWAALSIGINVAIWFWGKLELKRPTVQDSAYENRLIFLHRFWSLVRGTLMGIGLGMAVWENNTILTILVLQIIVVYVAMCAAFMSPLRAAVLANSLPPFLIPAGVYVLIGRQTGDPGPYMAIGATVAMNLILLRTAFNTRRLFINRARDVFERQQNLDHQVRRNDRLASEKAQIEESIKQRTDFFANVNHELRTPLNGLLGTIDVVLSTDLDDQQKSLLKLSKQSGLSLLSLINNLLDMAKLEAGGFKLHFEHASPREIIDHVGRLLSPEIEKKGLRLAYEIDDDLPETVIADRERVQQILFNFLGNAVKFTEKGNITICAKTKRTSSGDPMIWFGVRDTGSGMDEADLSGLFTRYYQTASGAAHAAMGTGLGLSIVRGLVVQMGGEVGVESTKGEGSLFWFQIPAAHKSGALPEAGPSENRLSAAG